MFLKLRKYGMGKYSYNKIKKLRLLQKRCSYDM